MGNASSSAHTHDPLESNVSQPIAPPPAALEADKVIRLLLPFVCILSSSSILSLPNLSLQASLVTCHSSGLGDILNGLCCVYRGATVEQEGGENGGMECFRLGLWNGVQGFFSSSHLRHGGDLLPSGVRRFWRVCVSLSLSLSLRKRGGGGRHT